MRYHDSCFAECLKDDTRQRIYIIFFPKLFAECRLSAKNFFLFFLKKFICRVSVVTLGKAFPFAECHGLTLDKEPSFTEIVCRVSAVTLGKAFSFAECRGLTLGKEPSFAECPCNYTRQSWEIWCFHAVFASFAECSGRCTRQRGLCRVWHSAKRL